MHPDVIEKEGAQAYFDGASNGTPLMGGGENNYTSDLHWYKFKAGVVSSMNNRA